MLHNINFFLDSLVKGDLRDIKGVRNQFLKKKILHAEVWILTAALLSLQDLKKPFERAWRDYESRL